MKIELDFDVKFVIQLLEERIHKLEGRLKEAEHGKLLLDTDKTHKDFSAKNEKFNPTQWVGNYSTIAVIDSAQRINEENIDLHVKISLGNFHHKVIPDIISYMNHDDDKDVFIYEYKLTVYRKKIEN